MNLARLQKDGGKWKVIDPRPGKGVEIFEAKDVERAITRHDEVNAEIAAEAAKPRAAIELLSLDGQPVAGIQTVQATSKMVFVTKPTEKNKLKAPVTTTEMDLCDVTGYVLVSRDGSGKVRAEWGNPADFGRYLPLSTTGIAALQAMFGAQQQ